MFHGLRRLPLGRGGHMGVGVQGEPSAVVAQHPGDGFHIHSVLQGQSCEGVSQIRKLFITTKTKRKKKTGSYRKTKTL